MSEDWRKHNGGPNPLPGLLVDLVWGDRHHRAAAFSEGQLVVQVVMEAI